MDDIWGEVANERTELADLLETISAEEWNAPSLCEEWTVRDVVAHLVLGSGKLGFTRTIGGMAKAGFRLNRFLAQSAKEEANQPPEDLLKKLRETANAKTTPPMTKPIDMLTDTMIHQQDIRRGLNKPRTIPEERLRLVLDATKVQQPILGAKKRIAGLTLDATDMEWSYGDGPEVKGPGEALLMAMSGRKAALDDLSGDGLATLRAR